MSRGRGTKREISYAQIRRTKQLFFDLLDHASLLSCSDPRDRIYAFLGHPSARAEDGERLIIDPDYTDDVNELYVKVTKLFFKTVGPRFLVAVEHTRESLADGYPSWAVRWHIAAKLNDISRPSWCDFQPQVALPTRSAHLPLRGRL